MLSHSVPLSCVVLATLLALPAIAGAQYNERQLEELRRRQQQQQQQNIPREQWQATGGVKLLRGLAMQMQTAEGETWLVQLQPQRPADMVFTGSADPSFLRPGMFVQFTTELTKRGNAQEPIRDLLITTIRDVNSAGVSPANAGAIGGGLGGANDLFGAPEEEPKKRAKVKTDENTLYRVGGQITKVGRTGEITVNAAGTTIKADVADDAKVSVDVNDFSFVRPGDKVELRGWYYAGNKGKGVANQVTISAAETLSSGKKKSLPAKAGDAKNADPADAKSAEEQAKKDLEGL